MVVMGLGRQIERLNILDVSSRYQLKLHSYTVARDFGFAPNPFFGWCTLATCKPDIRASAEVGDWIIGTGSAGSGNPSKRLIGSLVYAMRVDEVMTFEEYWVDPRFQLKKPKFHASKKYAYGDNIYHRKGSKWIQELSHHSYEDGKINNSNLSTDTKSEKILASQNFVYLGREAIKIPKEFRNYDGWDICVTRGRKLHHPEGLISEFLEWLDSLNLIGLQAFPRDW